MTADLEVVGAMCPFGQRKGYALAILAEALGALFTGYGAAYRDDYIEGNGTFIITIDIRRFVDLGTFRNNVDDLFAKIKSVSCDEYTEEILTPGEMEVRTRRERERDGIPFSDGTWQTIVEIARLVGVAISEASGR